MELIRRRDRDLRLSHEFAFVERSIREGDVGTFEARWESFETALRLLSDDDRELVLERARGRKIGELAMARGVKYSAMAIRLWRIFGKLRKVMGVKID